MTSKIVGYRKSDFTAWGEGKRPEFPWHEVEPLLPTVILRARYDKIAAQHGLPFSKRYLENLDSQGLGPRKMDENKW